MSVHSAKRDFAEIQKRVGIYRFHVDPFLRKLVELIPLQPISNRATYRRYMSILDVCIQTLEFEKEKYSKSTISAVTNYTKMLSGLIGEYEKMEFKLPKPTQADILKFFMDEHHLTQEDLKKELGGQPAVSNVLSGKRKLNVRQIAKLSKRFSISPATFFNDISEAG